METKYGYCPDCGTIVSKERIDWMFDMGYPCECGSFDYREINESEKKEILAGVGGE